MVSPDVPQTGRSLLLNPRRSAHATILGYLYQTCLGVLRWLDLQPDEILLCEPSLHPFPGSPRGSSGPYIIS